ncbi:MAG TPA: C40 family peptidase [Rhodanobacteraceae bacterium]
MRVVPLAALLLAFALPAAAAAAGSKPPVAWVDVSVATLWTSPSSPRPVDHPALTNPVNIKAWLAAMSTQQRAWLSAHNATQTQVLYGHKVYILAKQGDWYKVAVPGQPTPKNALGYPGWVPKVQLVTSPKYAQLKASRPFAVVDSAPTVWLYGDARLSKKFLRISFNTRLPVLARRAGAIEVATPANGPKWLAANTATIYKAFSNIPYPTAAQLIQTGKLFMGLPYLWGGRSGFAYDCSGFTATIYQAHGIILPRDASGQAADTRVVKIDKQARDLRPGTLMFYADKHGTGHVYHVAMYIGGGRMMEAYDSAVPVRTTMARFGKDYWGAVRVLDTPAAPRP